MDLQQQADVEPELFDTVVRLVEQGRYAPAVEIFTRLADQGHPDVAVHLGDLYAHGSNDLAIDLGKAELWYERAIASSGNVDARFGLAVVILRQRADTARTTAIPEQRVARLLALLTDLAEEGHVRGAVLLGMMLTDGQLVQRQLSRARSLLEIGATAGYAIAPFYLARIAFCEGRQPQGVVLLLRGIMQFIRVYIRNRDDDRLFMFPLDRTGHLVAQSNLLVPRR